MKNELTEEENTKLFQKWEEEISPTIKKSVKDFLTGRRKAGYFTLVIYENDLDYCDFYTLDITPEEFLDIIAIADKHIKGSKDGTEELAVAYLKKAQCLQKHEEYSKFEKIDSKDDYQNINTDIQIQIKYLLEKTLELIPNMPEALMQMGKYYFNMSIAGNDDFEKAIDMYTIAIQLKPDYAAAYNNRGVLYASEVYSRIKNTNPEDNWYKAINDFSEALRIRPFDAMYYFNRGKNYSKLGEHQKSVDDYSGAIQHCSDEFKKKIPLYYLRGDEYMWLRCYDKAIGDFSESIRLWPDLIRAFLMRGNAYLGAGDEEKAKADFDEYLRRKNKNKAAEKQFAFFLNAPRLVICLMKMVKGFLLLV